MSNSEMLSRIGRMSEYRKTQIKNMEREIKEVLVFFASIDNDMPNIVREHIGDLPDRLSEELEDLKNTNKLYNEIAEMLRSKKKVFLKVGYWEESENNLCSEQIYVEGILSGSNHNKILIFNGNRYRGRLIEVPIDSIYSLEIISTKEDEIDLYLENNEVKYSCSFSESSVEFKDDLEDIKNTIVYVNGVEIGERVVDQDLEKLFRTFIRAVNNLSEKGEELYTINHTYEIIDEQIVDLITLNGIKVSNSFLNVDLFYKFFQKFNLKYDTVSYSYDVNVFRKTGELYLEMEE